MSTTEEHPLSVGETAGTWQTLHNMCLLSSTEHTLIVRRSSAARLDALAWPDAHPPDARASSILRYNAPLALAFLALFRARTTS
jgi:hypothetical protein